MAREDVLALFEGERAGDVTQPIAQGDQGNVWVAQVTGDQTAPPPPPPLPEAAAPAPVTPPATPPPPPAMPAPTTTAAPATPMAAPAEKSGGGWEVDTYRIRAFGDAVVRARAYLDAVRMKVDRMQGAELTPQLGTSPVGRQLGKKFDDRLNADQGLRAMLTEAMKRMERFVATAEEASRAYEQAEENAVETIDKFKFEVEWADEFADDHGHGHHHGHGQDEDQEPAEDEVEDPADDEAGDPAEDQAENPAEEHAEDQRDEPAHGEVEAPAGEHVEDLHDDPAHDQVEDPAEDQAEDPAHGQVEDPAEEPAGNQGQNPGQDEPSAGNGRGKPD